MDPSTELRLHDGSVPQSLGPTIAPFHTKPPSKHPNFVFLLFLEYKLISWPLNTPITDYILISLNFLSKQTFFLFSTLKKLKKQFSFQNSSSKALVQSFSQKIHKSKYMEFQHELPFIFMLRDFIFFNDLRT